MYFYRSLLTRKYYAKLKKIINTRIVPIPNYRISKLFKLYRECRYLIHRTMLSVIFLSIL